MPGGYRDLLHDLGDDLATLSCLVEALRGDPMLPAQARRRVELIDEEMARLRDHVQHAVTRSPQPGTVSVREVAERVVTLTDAAAPTRVVLRRGAAASLCIDEPMLWRIVKNVVDNAVRAAGPSGRVEVDVAESAGQVIISVADDGNGSPGSLGIVRGLVSARGGTVDVRARLPRGTCVRVALP